MTKRTKKAIKENIVGLIFIVALFLVIGWCGTLENTREITASVYSIDDNIITFKDYAGDLWEWEKEDKEQTYTKYENVILVLNMQGTRHTWYDDTIRRIKRNK